MGRRPDRSVGALAACSRVAVVVVFIVCASLLLVMVATTSGVGVSVAAGAGGRAMKTTSSAVGYSGGGQAGEDAYRNSKRRIPKGPDPIHNRRAGKTTIAPRRRD